MKLKFNMLQYKFKKYISHQIDVLYTNGMSSFVHELQYIKLHFTQSCLFFPEVQEYFCKIIKEDEDISVGVAAIRTLMEVIKHSKCI